MLSSSSVSPRPLPPAKARKPPSLAFAALHTDGAPPPPYAPPLEELILDSPVTVTTHLMNASKSTDGIGLPGSPGIQEWMNGRSREELSELLLKADGMIKSRETELTVTTTLCKSLYSDNVTLKSKHEALLARLPNSGATPSTASPPVPELHLGIPPSDSASVAFPTSPDQSAFEPLGLAARYRRARRVSVTPAELASLADQNAELIEKLETLEDESLKADQAGKRKLRKLEQEIQSLRDELEKAQVRGVELEQQAKAATSAVSAQKRKEEREARLQALKERSMSVAGSDHSAEGVRDFAPPSYLARSSPAKRSVSGSSAFAPDTSLTGSDRSVAHRSSFDENDVDPESYFPTPPGSSVELPQAEYAIVSQLLLKIRELEETNSQIKEQQRLTEERVRATQFDVESIRKVYEYLDDGDIELEIEEEGLDAPKDLDGPPLPENTIRFSSLRRSIAGSMSKLMVPSESDVFAGGITQGMQSTVRTAMINRIAHNKARKTVVGLFDSDADTSAESSAVWGEYPHMLQVSPAFRPSQDAITTAWSSAATDGGLEPSTPPLSAPLDAPMTGRSLGSELGSEYGGEDWGQGGINHHLRASSLCDFSGLGSSPVSPSESVAALPPITLLSSVEEHNEEDWDGLEPSTPPRVPPLQLNVQPPTPVPDKHRSPAVQRQLQLSRTVRARTNRWVEGRFPQSPSWQDALREEGASSSTSTLGRRSSGLFRKVNPEVLGETFDDVAGQIRRVASRGAFAPLALASEGAAAAEERPKKKKQKEEGGEGVDRSVAVRPDESLGGKHHAGIVGFVIEAWLWLQFIVVVALFLWAMAKRGPKVVLEAERRSAHRSR